MKYVFLLFHEDPPPRSGPPDAAELAGWRAFAQKAAKIATPVADAALQPSITATVVSVREGKRIVTDGPFLETKEQLGGFYVFECADLDVALDLAAQIPWAPTGHIEVRPLMVFD